MRPPQRSRASRMVTLLPAPASSRAVIRPAAPAPTTRKSVRCRGAIDYLALTLASGRRSLHRRARPRRCRGQAGGGAEGRSRRAYQGVHDCAALPHSQRAKGLTPQSAWICPAPGCISRREAVPWCKDRSLGETMRAIVALYLVIGVVL